MSIRHCAAALAAAFQLALPAAASAAAEKPAWWDSQLGTEPIVLPGFEPLRVAGTSVELFARRYVWDRSFLPVRIDSLGHALTGPLELVALIGGRAVSLGDAHVVVAEAGDDHVVVRATGNPVPGLSVTCTTRIEYDGVAMVTLELQPSQPVNVEGLYNQVDVLRNQWSRIVAFEASADPDSDDNARHMRKQTFFPGGFQGHFRNVLGFPDGDRSFWWFADDAEGWVWNGPVVTGVEELPGRYRVRQHLIGAPFRIDRPMSFRFNFLATPVRDLGTQWRTERVTNLPPESSGEVGKFQLWWTDVFAGWLLPYSELPPEVRREFPEEDWDSYPGRESNRKLMQQYESKGFHRLPYFSSHCLSPFDPALRRFRAEWEMEPAWVIDGTPCLSHRAKGYSNYLLQRFDAEIDALGMTGVYFDHAGVSDSRNPAHDGWVDSNGRRQASLDILPYRAFLKRLRVLFHQKGKPGYIFAHASNSEVIPALTFVTSLLDGEQFRSTLRDDDYIGSVSLDEVRSLYAGNQYGVLNTWLPETWALHKQDPRWAGSREQFRSYRNFMTLALLHDIPVHPAGASRSDYDALVRRLDDFGVAASEFVGYWRESSGVSSAAPDAPISFYRRADRSGALLIVANLRAADRTLSAVVDPAKLGLVGGAFSFRIRAGAAMPLPAGGRLRIPLPGRDFGLVEILAAD